MWEIRNASGIMTLHSIRRVQENNVSLRPNASNACIQVVSLSYWNSTRNVLDCDQSNYSSRIIFSYTFSLEPNTNGIGEPFPRYGHSKLYKTADGRDLGFGPTESRDIRSADPKTLTYRTKHEVSPMNALLRYARHSKFSKMRGRSLVVGWSVLNIYIVVMYSSSPR